MIFFQWNTLYVYLYDMETGVLVEYDSYYYDYYYYYYHTRKCKVDMIKKKSSFPYMTVTLGKCFCYISSLSHPSLFTIQTCVTSKGYTRTANTYSRTTTSRQTNPLIYPPRTYIIAYVMDALQRVYYMYAKLCANLLWSWPITMNFLKHFWHWNVCFSVLW